MSMTDAQLEACPASRYEGDPTRCRWCNGELAGRRRRWCSAACGNAFAHNHWWTAARHKVMFEAKRTCAECGGHAHEVHHRTPILGRHAETGCHHHLDGLVALCHDCHLSAHREIAAAAPDGQLRLDAA